MREAVVTGLFLGGLACASIGLIVAFGWAVALFAFGLFLMWAALNITIEDHG